MTGQLAIVPEKRCTPRGGDVDRNHGDSTRITSNDDTCSDTKQLSRLEGRVEAISGLKPSQKQGLPLARDPITAQHGRTSFKPWESIMI